MKCILVASKGNEESEKYFYENILKLAKEFLCTDSLEQARLMVIGNSGYLPVDEVGHLPNVMDGIRRIPLYKKDKPIEKNYFACWHKERTNYYVEEFAKLLKDLLN